MPMIKSKRQYVCSNCKTTYIKWSGVCYRGCKYSGTIDEVVLIATAKKGIPTSDAKRLQRRAKDSERDIAKRMVAADGADPAFRNIASSTGRIGFITGMMVDAVSMTYVTENKNRKMPTWVIDAWVKINQRGVDFDKNVLLHIDPPNMPRTFVIQGTTKKLDTMAVITQSRHEDLIQNEKILAKLLHEIQRDRKYAALDALYEQSLRGDKT